MVTAEGDVLPEEDTVAWSEFLDNSTFKRVPDGANISTLDMSGHPSTILWQRLPFEEADADSPQGPMFVLRFPCSIALPGLITADDTADLLFIRQDDLDLFKVTRRTRNVVLTGNPGVGKSWFHARFIVFCARPDIYMALSGDAEFPRDFRGRRDPPKYIFRMVVTENKGCVFDLVNKRLLPPSKSSLANKPHSTLLYEPGSITDPAPLDTLLAAQCIMTVSPDLNRYKNFLSQRHVLQAVVMYTPCHFAAELLAMGRVLSPRFVNSSENPFTEGQILSRLDQYGPFVRYVVAPFNDQADRRQKKALGGLDVRTIVSAKRTIERNAGDGAVYVSFWLLKYTLPRDAAGRVLNFTNAALEPSTPAVLARLNQRLPELRRSELLEQFAQLAGPDG